LTCIGNRIAIKVAPFNRLIMARVFPIATGAGVARHMTHSVSRSVDADPDSVPDVSLVDRTLPSGPEVAAAAGIMARMTLGEEPERVSALDYARLWSGDDLMVPQGYGTLVGRFGQSFHAQLNSPLSAIDWAATACVSRPRTGHSSLIARSSLSRSASWRRT
jgi:hypothetical protein